MIIVADIIFYTVWLGCVENLKINNLKISLSEAIKFVESGDYDLYIDIYQNRYFSAWAIMKSKNKFH